MSRRDYMDEWSTTRIVFRLMFTLSALIGLWVSFWNNDLRWEILFAAYFVVQNVEHAAEKILHAIGQRR